MWQAQVVEPAGIVERADVGAFGARAGEVLAEDLLRVLDAEGCRIGSRGELEQGVQAAREMVVAALAEVLQMVFGKIVLHRQQLVAGRRGATFGRGQRAAKGAALENVPARQLSARLKPAEELQRCSVLDQVVHGPMVGS